MGDVNIVDGEIDRVMVADGEILIHPDSGFSRPGFGPGGVHVVGGGVNVVDGGVNVVDGGVNVVDGGVNVVDGPWGAGAGGVNVVDGMQMQPGFGGNLIIEDNFGGGVNVCDGGVNVVDHPTYGHGPMARSRKGGEEEEAEEEEAPEEETE